MKNNDGIFPNKLATFTNQELQAEIARRNELAAKAEDERLKTWQKIILEGIDAILPLCNHSSIDQDMNDRCSDREKYCIRCYLLYVKKMGCLVDLGDIRT